MLRKKAMDAKRLISVILLSLIPIPSTADALIDLETGACHFPKDANDIGNETKAMCEGYLVEIEGVSAVRGAGYFELREMPIAYPDIGIYDVSNRGDKDNPCVMIDNEGNITLVNNWRTRIEATCSPNTIVPGPLAGFWRDCTLIARLSCWD